MVAKLSGNDQSICNMLWPDFQLADTKNVNIYNISKTSALSSNPSPRATINLTLHSSSIWTISPLSLPFISKLGRRDYQTPPQLSGLNGESGMSLFI